MSTCLGRDIGLQCAAFEDRLLLWRNTLACRLTIRALPKAVFEPKRFDACIQEAKSELRPLFDFTKHPLFLKLKASGSQRNSQRERDGVAELHAQQKALNAHLL